MPITSSPWNMTRKFKRRKLDENTRPAIQFQRGRHWLPEDVIREILVRLPPNSIIRFKSVCKLWYSLIHSSYFSESHRNHCLVHKNNPNSLFYSWLGKRSFRVYALDSSLSQSPTPVFDAGAVLRALKARDPREHMRRFRDAGFSNLDWETEALTHALEPNVVVAGPLHNGVFAVFSEVWVMARRRKAYGYYSAALCNPATGQYELLPTLPVLRNGYSERAANLFCKQYYGIACVRRPGSNLVLDYKVIMITWMRSWARAFVYSRSRGFWTQISDVFPGFLLGTAPIIAQDFDFLPQAFVNGYCHWTTTDQTDHSSSILRFDVTTEAFDLIPGPPSEYPNPTARDAYCIRRGVFAAADDRLAAIVMIQEPLASTTVSHTIDVWMMTDYGIEKSWTKIHSSRFQFAGELTKYLGMLFDRDNHLERMFFQDKGGMLLSYDCSSCTLKEQASSNSFMPGYNGCNGAWACWKPIGVSYVDTLDPPMLGLSTHLPSRRRMH